jgi:hypothetical protein
MATEVSVRLVSSGARIRPMLGRDDLAAEVFDADGLPSYICLHAMATEVLVKLVSSGARIRPMLGRDDLAAEVFDADGLPSYI